MFFLPYAYLLWGYILYVYLPSIFVSCFHLLVSSMSLPGDDVLCWLFLVSISFCLLPLLFSPTMYPVWFGLVYPVTTAGFRSGSVNVR